MAFNQQQTSREAVNRKILEDLQLKKQLLLKQGVAQSLTDAPPVPSTFTPAATSTTTGPDGSSLNSMQRAALENAHATSMGYFITTDSSFGNVILPVLPRYYETEDQKKS